MRFVIKTDSFEDRKPPVPEAKLEKFPYIYAKNTIYEEIKYIIAWVVNINSWDDWLNFLKQHDNVRIDTPYCNHYPKDIEYIITIDSMSLEDYLESQNEYF